MAGSRKEYELLFKLKAALGGNFNGTFQSALKHTRELQNTIQRVNSIQGKIGGYQKQSAAITTNKEKLAELNEEHERLQQEMNATEQPSEALRKKFERNQKQIEKTTSTIEEQERQLGEMGDELRRAGVNTDNLEGSNARLKRSYEALKKSQEEYARINADQQKNAAAIEKTRGQITKSVGLIAAGGAAVFAGAVKPAMEFESAFAGVKKTIDGTPEQLLKIQNGIRKMSMEIPSSVVEIAAVAEAAGQLGIKTDSILGFVRVMSDLGVATNLTGDEAASTLAKFANITGMPQENFDRLGSTIVALGNNLATTEADIAAMALRLAGAGKQVGLSEAQILSFSGALSSVGIEAEAGGSAFSKVLANMQLAVETGNESLQDFSKVAGMSASEFKTAFQSDAASAMTSFIKGLSESEKKGVSAIKVLDDMGITEIRMRDALLRAAGASDIFTDALSLGSKAWEENTALQKEAEQRYGTTESSMKILKQAFNDIGISIGSVFLPQIAESSKKLTELVKKFSEFAQENPELIKTVTKVAAGLAGLSVAGLGAKLGFLELKGGVLNVQKVFALFKGKIAEAGAAGATHSGKLAAMGRSLSEYFGGVKNSLGGLGGSIDKLFGGKLSSMFSKIGGGISNSILKPIGAIGGKIGGLMGGVGGKIAGAFGKVGGAIANGPLGKIGGIFKSLGGVASSALGPVVKGLGAGFGGLFGKIMPIIMIVSLLSALFIKLSGGDISGFIEPLKQAFEQAKPVLQSIMQQLQALGKELLPLLMDAAQKLAPLFGQIVTAILPVILQLIEQLVPLFITVVQQILPVILNLITQLAPLFTQIITAILPVVVELLKILLPIITQLVTSVLPVIVQVLDALMPIITQLIQAVLPVLMSILQALMPVITILADIFGSVLGAAIQSISEIIGGVMKILQGLIDFVVGIFTGNWSQAWEGVKSIFSGIFDSLAGIVKAPINAVIGIINGAISGINKIGFVVPDWVPFIGGQDFKINIPEIPMLAKGSQRTPETFIAGEKGAELITNAKNRAVFTAAQTGQIMNNINSARTGQSDYGGVQEVVMLAPALQAILSTSRAAAAAGGVNMPQYQPATVTAGAAGARTISVMYQPTIVVDGSRPDNLDEKLRKSNEELVRQLDERDRNQADDERRGRYDL